MNNRASFFLIVVGLSLIILAAFFYWERNTPTRLFFSLDKEVHNQNVSSQVVPTRIYIPKAKINLPIFPARIINNSWEDTKDGVSYLSSTPLPGKPGNSVIYGHNWNSLLGNLVKVKNGDEIEVEFSNGEIKKFRTAFTQIVSPDQTNILKSTSETRLTVYTCTGFLDSKRFVVVAGPQEENRAQLNSSSL